MPSNFSSDPLPEIKMVWQSGSLAEPDLHWHPQAEGQLAVDVLETETDVIILSTLAGADIDNLEISLHNDLFTIRGERPEPVLADHVRTFYQECFWGKFSRTIVLPIDVKGDLARAEYKNGVLTITIPKQKQHARIPVVIVEE